MWGFNWRRLSRCGRHDGVHFFFFLLFFFFSLSSKPTRAWRHAKSKIMCVVGNKSRSYFAGPRQPFSGLLSHSQNMLPFDLLRRSVYIIYAWHLPHFCALATINVFVFRQSVVSWLFAGAWWFILGGFHCEWTEIPMRSEHIQMMAATWLYCVSLLTFWIISLFFFFFL